MSEFDFKTNLHVYQNLVAKVKGFEEKVCANINSFCPGDGGKIKLSCGKEISTIYFLRIRYAFPPKNLDSGFFWNLGIKMEEVLHLYSGGKIKILGIR